MLRQKTNNRQKAKLKLNFVICLFWWLLQGAKMKKWNFNSLFLGFKRRLSRGSLKRQNDMAYLCSIWLPVDTCNSIVKIYLYWLNIDRKSFNVLIPFQHCRIMETTNDNSFITTAAQIRIDSIELDNTTVYKDTEQMIWQSGVAESIFRYHMYVLLAIGLPGNCAAIVTFMTMRKRNSSHIILIALSVTDSINLVYKFLFSNLPIYGVTFSDIVCQFYLFLGTLLWHVPNLLLILLTTTKCIAIWFPMKVKMLLPPRKQICGIGISFLILFILNFPMIFESKYLHKSLFPCGFLTSNVVTIYWHWTHAVFFAFLPITILIVENIVLLIGIKRAENVRSDLASTQNPICQNIQVTVMVIVVCFVFVMLNSPVCIFFIYKEYWDYKSDKVEKAKYFLMYQIVFLLAEINHVINFYLYVVSGTTFRRQFCMLVTCKHWHKTRNRNRNPVVLNVYTIYMQNR